MPISLSQFEWLIPGQLMVNAFPRSETYPLLWQMGVRAILTLCAEGEGSLPPIPIQYSFAWQRYALPDSRHAEPLKAEALADAVALVHHWIIQDMPVYVHCWAGMERSPLVAIAYLCAYHHLEVWEALTVLKQHHPRTTLQSSQLQVLRVYLQQQVSQ